jgi:hypothetical protein
MNKIYNKTQNLICKMKNMRIMRLSIIILILLSGFSLKIHAEDSTYYNLFEYGAPIASSEDNLKNLLRNFPLYIKNADQYELLNYKYVGIIKNKKQIKRYVKNNFNKRMSVFVISTSTTTTTGSPDKSEICLEIQPAMEHQDLFDVKSVVDNISNEYIHPGYEVYILKFIANLKMYNYYIFINPQTKRVVTKGNMFGFNIPEKHFINSSGLVQ